MEEGGWTEEEKKAGCCFNLESDEGRKLMNDLDYLRFTVADLHGIGRCKAVPRRHFEHYVKRGVDFYAGASWSDVSGGLSSGFLATNNANFVSGVRFRF